MDHDMVLDSGGGKQAFITGGNGVIGRAILKQLLERRSHCHWKFPIIVTSPHLIESDEQDPRILFVQLDFMKNVKSLKRQIELLCDSVTHAFFLSYVHRYDDMELESANCKIFQNFLHVIESVAPKLENVILLSDANYYNLHLKPLPWPIEEEDPPASVYIPNFYRSQEEFLDNSQLQKTWSFNIIRPGAVIDDSRRFSGLNMALTIAIYFLVCKELDVSAPMPTNQIYWDGVESVTNSRMVADLTVFVATSPQCENQEFNVNNGDVFSWRYMWPALAAYFGADAPATQIFTKPRPKEGNSQQEFSLADWAKDKEAVWLRLCQRMNAGTAVKAFEYGSFARLDQVFGRCWYCPLGLLRARLSGWTAFQDSYSAFTHAFDQFKEYGILPP